MGDQEVHPSVVVEIRQFDRPGPIRLLEAGQVRDLHKPLCFRVQVECVPHVLLRFRVLHEVKQIPHGPHGGLLHEVRRGRHLGDEKIQAAVVVDIPNIGPMENQVEWGTTSLSTFRKVPSPLLW